MDETYPEVFMSEEDYESPETKKYIQKLIDEDLFSPDCNFDSKSVGMYYFEKVANVNVQCFCDFAKKKLVEFDDWNEDGDHNKMLFSF